MNSFAIEGDELVRVLGAIALGGVVGFEREANDQAAGLRTHISVALGACVFGIVSTLGFRAYEATEATNVQVDVTRVASNVVVGIGFIGAGVIFRHGATVRHLTTAATLWVTAAIGLAAGTGNLGLATVGTAGLVASLGILRLPRRWIRRRITKKVREIEIGLGPGDDPTPVLQDIRAAEGLTVKAVHTEKMDGCLVLQVAVETDPAADWDDLLVGLAARAEVVRLVPSVERELTSD
jgi:putative Mg2+ transporter-C (MgtC) family protein